MIDRRDFLTLAGAAATAPAWPFAGLAQVPAKVPRVAYLSIPQPPQYDDAFRQGLADFGYADGRNIAVEYFVAPTLNDLPAFASRAVASQPDVIASSGTPASLAAKNVAGSIPIVFSNLADPIAVGLVSSLARPGGNITGNTNQTPDLAGKQVEIMKEIVPSLKRLAILDVTDDPAATSIVAQVRAAATALKMEPVNVAFVSTGDFATQFAAVVAAQPQAVHVPAGTYLAGNATNRALLVDLLLKNKLPAVGIGPTPGATPTIVGLVGYGPSVPDLFRQSAGYVVAILKGTKPQDLPVAQPTNFEFVINVGAAKTMGLTIPDTVVARATQVIS